MTRFLENEPYYSEDDVVGDMAYAPPAFSTMRMAGTFMLLATISSYAVLFWLAKKRSRRVKIKDIINRTLDEEGSFLDFAPCSAKAATNRTQHDDQTLFGRFTHLSSSLEEQDNDYLDANQQSAHDVFAHMNNSDDCSCIDSPEKCWTKFAACKVTKADHP